MTITEQYKSTMRTLLADIVQTAEQAEHDASLWFVLADKLDTARDILQIELEVSRRPQIDALAPPDMDD